MIILCFAFLHIQSDEKLQWFFIKQRNSLPSFVLCFYTFVQTSLLGFYICLSVQFKMWSKAANMVQVLEVKSENFYIELVFAFGLTLLLGVTIQDHLFVRSKFEMTRESLNVTRNANQSILFFNRVPKVPLKRNSFSIHSIHPVPLNWLH